MAYKSNQPEMFAPPAAPIKPYTGAFGRKQLMHLLRRTMFGVSNADLKAFEGKTLDQVVTALLNVTDFNPAPPLNDYSVVSGAYLQEPVYEKNPDGSFKLDKDGNKIPTYQKNADGTFKLDSNGNKIPATQNVIDPVTKKPIIATFATGGEDSGIKFGETWVNATSNGTVDFARRASFKTWWANLMVNQERNIREKMTLFFANHFSMESDTVNNAIYTYRSNQLTRKYCLGNFKDLIRDMTIDTGMLVYLNGSRNNKTAPDENYGRELQELFTVGKGPDSHYTEDDVKAAAKVLTGWSLTAGKPDLPATFKPALHDTTDKTFSAFYGNKIIKGDASANGGQNEINAMLDMIFANTEVAKFIVRKLYTFFVYYNITPDIETNVITPLADLFRTGKYEIKPVLKALLTSDEFYKASNMGCMTKSPIDHIVGLYRQYEIPVPKDPALFEATVRVGRIVAANTANLGQNIQDPPNVAGWPAYYQAPFYYDSWLDTATYPKRKKTQEGLVSNAITTPDGISVINPAARSLSIKIDYATWLKGFSNPVSAFDLINDLAELLYGVPVSQTVKDKLKTNKLWYSIGSQTITTDKQWSDAVTAYMANPATTDAMAKTLPTRLQKLVTYMMSAAEYQLH